MIKKYFNFELKISPMEDQIMIDIHSWPTVINLPKQIPMLLECQPVDWEKLATCNPQDVAALGNSLYRLVFVQEIESRFQAYLNRREQEEGVRLYVSDQFTDLSKAAWETLCSQLEPASNFLALDPRTPIARSLRIGTEVYIRMMKTPLRLLVFLASPRLVPPIDWKKEKSSLEQALGEAIESGKIEVDYLGFDDKRTESSFYRLQKFLAEKEVQYDIVHIISHGLLEAGQEGKIACEQPEDGKQQNVSASSLANLFRSRKIMLVILQSCQSGAVDQSLSFSSAAQQLVASGVPAVLAMQEIIDQDVATCFINRLYAQWLGAGCTFEDSLTQARQSVYQNFPDRIAAWAIPVLYIVPGIELSVDNTISPDNTNERHVEAALPQQARVNQELELVVLVHAPTMQGLREVIDARPQDFDVTSDDVKTSPKFEVSFPINKETGKVSPTSVKIVVETADFDVSPRSEEKVQISPQGDSVFLWFFVRPKREGCAKLLLRVLDNQEQISLAQLLLKVKVRGSDDFENGYFETEYQVVGAEQVLTPGETAEKLYPKDSLINPVAKAIFDGEEDDVVEGLQKAIDAGKDPIALINEALMPGMEIVSKLYDDGVIFMPNLMMSADAMLEGIDFLIQKAGKAPEVKGKVICYFTEGDVHDIGKSIVTALLRANGYDVVNLGREVSVDEVIAAVEKEKPLMLTGTAHMTTTMHALKEVNDKLLEKGYRIPFACGGNAVNQDFVSQYELGVYGEEAADAPKIADFIKEHGDDIAQLRQKFHKH